MKEIKEEAKRHHEAKLHKYGADHKACGGSMKKYADGGKVHPHKEHDKHLASEIKHEAEEIERDHKKHGGKVHRMDGGATPRLGRGRKGKGKGTNVNIAIAPKGPDAAGAPMMPPPALGSGPSAMPPKPVMPAPAMAGPRPMPAPGAKHGGKIEHHKHEKYHGKHSEHKHHERHHSGHRGH